MPLESTPDRRSFLGIILTGTAGVVAGAAAGWKGKEILDPPPVCPPQPPPCPPALPDSLKGLSAAGDIIIMNEALGLEHQAIAAYAAGAGLGVLSKGVLAVAVSFMQQHEAHRDVLVKTIEAGGGKAVTPLETYDFGLPAKPAEADVLKLALKLEEGAVAAYHARIPKIFDRELINGAAAILGDEASHVVVLRQALKLPPPDKFIGYSAF